MSVIVAQINPNGTAYNNLITANHTRNALMGNNGPRNISMQPTPSSNEVILEIIHANYDAIWILLSAFIIFTMHSGFALLEAGLISRKGEANVMVKNITDVVMGGLAFWIFGYGFCYGTEEASNSFIGIGNFFAISDGSQDFYVRFFFQLSFAMAANTIAAGAMLERVNIKAYILFAFFNVLSYCMPCHWVWSTDGWLYKLGAVDIAGDSAVHMVGGAAALAAAMYLKPRKGIFSKNAPTQAISPINVALGTFFLWWGWLGFNCGSTFGVSEGKWMAASKAAVATMLGSIGGGVFAYLYCYVIRKSMVKGKLEIATLATGVLGGLVGVTASCAVIQPWAAVLIGFIGGGISIAGIELMEFFHIDDPVGCVGVHLMTGGWGLIAVALFADKDQLTGFSADDGVLKGGSGKFLGVQLLTAFVVPAWSFIVSLTLLYIIDRLIGLRLTDEEESLGTDYVLHGIADFSHAEDSSCYEENVLRTKKFDIYINEKHFSSDSTFPMSYSRLEGDPVPDPQKEACV